MITVARFEFEDADGIHKNDIRWDASTGSLEMCDGIDAYAQTLEAVIKTVQGELITRRNYGIPYFTTIFSSKIHADEWADAVKNAVEALDFVASLDLFEYEYDQKRKYMTYKLAVTTTDGTPVQITEI